MFQCRGKLDPTFAELRVVLEHRRQRFRDVAQLAEDFQLGSIRPESGFVQGGEATERVQCGLHAGTEVLGMDGCLRRLEVLLLDEQVRKLCWRFGHGGYETFRSVSACTSPRALVPWKAAGSSSGGICGKLSTL